MVGVDVVEPDGGVADAAPRPAWGAAPRRRPSSAPRARPSCGSALPSTMAPLALCRLRKAGTLARRWTAGQQAGSYRAGRNGAGPEVGDGCRGAEDDAGAAQGALPGAARGRRGHAARRGRDRRRGPRLSGRDRAGDGRGGAAPRDRRLGAAGVLGRHAARGAGRLRRRDARARSRPRSSSATAPAACTPRATSISAARSASRDGTGRLPRHPARFELDTDESEERRATLLKLTERYCVVLQTLRAAPPVAATLGARAA